MYAPIVLFAFNRLEPLKRCVASLLQNSEAAESDLIVFVDGPRAHKDGESEKVMAVREYVKTIAGFKSLETHFSKENKGLGPSIIAGVTDVISRYGKVIVIEDDLIVSRNMLAYVNQGLDKYENSPEVFSVCAYSNRVKTPNGYAYDAYFAPRSSSWGWATWEDRWMSCDWELRDWEAVVQNAKAFNRWGGSDCFGMLKGWKEGRNKSWAIRFCYSQFVQDGVSLFPTVSKIDNEGFDGTGTNCHTYSRFRFDFDEGGNKDFCFPNVEVRSRSLIRQSLWYNSIPLRAYSKLRYMLDDLKNKYQNNTQVIMSKQITPPQTRIVSVWTVNAFRTEGECVTCCRMAA